MKKSMIDYIGTPAMLEQMAEEAAELAKAALKLARIERGENPTPVTREEAIRSLIEEYTDVIQCAENLDLQADYDQMEEKYARFIKRYEELEKNPTTKAEPEAQDLDLAERLERNRTFVERNKEHLKTEPLGKMTIKRTQVAAPEDLWIFFE